MSDGAKRTRRIGACKLDQRKLGILSTGCCSIRSILTVLRLNYGNTAAAGACIIVAPFRLVACAAQR